MRPLPAALALLAVAAAVYATRPGPTAGADGEPVVVPFAVDAFRVPGVVDSRVLFCNPGESALRVEAWRVVSDGAVLHEEALRVELAADPRYARVNALIERLPAELTELHRPRAFAPPEAATFRGQELLDRWAEVQALLGELRAAHAAGAPRSFVEVAFPLPLDQVFYADDPPGTVRSIEVLVEYRDRAGDLAVASATHSIRRLPAPLDPPAELGIGGVTLHSGDLHVHSCHGEAVAACAPSLDCAAESFQTTGSFTYGELKSQYQALGHDWFTATDHSYCIDTAGEYAQIVGECAALTDAAFLVVPDTELSSDEEGPQVGSDIGDLACLGTTQANHMGAHGIAAWKPGGDDAFLGFCDGLFTGDALSPFTANAAAIRAEGGYPIIDHPVDGSSWAWNSKAATQGIEGDQMHGVEIWNGSTQSGQGGHVGDWVDWLLGGRILYAYAGSDTHDAAFAFGANHAVFAGEPFTIPNLEAALKAGRSFVSNGHVLILEAEVDGVVLDMGTLQALSPNQPATGVTVRAHYNFGADTSAITLFRGAVGDAAETVLCQSGPLTGAGVFECADALGTVNRTWYRAYSESGAQTAYTNPIFFLPGSCGYAQYGTGLGGANIATLSSVSSPTVGAVNALEVAGYDPTAASAMFGLSNVQVPAGSPLLGGFLLIGLPPLFVGNAPLVGGSGSFVFQVPDLPGIVGKTYYWQSAAFDPLFPGNLAFSSALSMPVCDLLQ